MLNNVIPIIVCSLGKSFLKCVGYQKWHRLGFLIFVFVFRSVLVLGTVCLHELEAS